MSGNLSNPEPQEELFMKKIKTLLALSVACAAVLLAGCNTFRGVGQDVQKVGEKIENAAKK
jgi:entericidin A